jgi:Na+-transporting methylmalonyl-CoA/oxaloacetate decarboxylase gamma subunit
MIKLLFLTVVFVFIVSCASNSEIKRDVASDEEKQEESKKVQPFQKVRFLDRK